MELGVQEDVSGLHIAVDDGRIDGVEVREGGGRLDGDGKAEGPGEEAFAGAGAVEMVVDGAVRHEFVDEEEISAYWGCAAVEGYQIYVAEPRKDLDLVDELLGSLEIGLVETLHGDGAAIAELACNGWWGFYFSIEEWRWKVGLPL
ncbi:hypothetical protein AXF42_Ash014376 [Apostasia shenzhenica]|uniref:Uncharacterized protein n=1 Tax=Apostasia shenzhenica TaxID=1088818 RepID=A0A2I0B107_9ASPA|nr:hypothetical protein AXF42_Ash014376 [Apostasia shenzhenica]